MIEGVTFPDSYAYKIVVPTANKTHKPDYLARVNSSFSAFLSEVAPENVFPIGHHHIIRNISPHGLGGVLVFDSLKSNFFELPLERQYNMEDRVERIVDFLEANYGQDFHVVTGMATSSDPGSGRGQSIAFAHIHISLLPKNLPASGYIHGMKMEKSGVAIRYTTFPFDNIRNGDDTISSLGRITLPFDNGRPLSHFQRQNADIIAALLLAQNPDGDLYGTQWIIHRGISQQRILGVCPGIGYLPALGFGLKRDTDVSAQYLAQFEQFNGGVFTHLKDHLLSEYRV